MVGSPNLSILHWRARNGPVEKVQKFPRSIQLIKRKFEEVDLKAFRTKINAAVVLATLSMSHVASANAVDPGSLQAALDHMRYGEEHENRSLTLSSFYQKDGMVGQWNTKLSQRVALLMGEVAADVDPTGRSSFQKAQWDIGTSVRAIRLINSAKGASFPQQKATAEDLRDFKQALLTGQEQQFLNNMRTESSLLSQLRKAEDTYSAAVTAGGWHATDSSDMMFADHGADVGQLKQRLAAEGYPAGSGDLFDVDLSVALEQYQEVQGIEVSGLLDGRTQKSLNVPAWKRLQTVRANIARFEAKKGLDTENHIVVNIPAFKARYFNGGKNVWQDRVIVGKADRRTPQIASKIEKVVFNPSWYVPSKLVYRDVLPRASREPSYWTRMGYMAYDKSGQIIDVTAGAGMESVFTAQNLRIKQAPGPRNALGQVKFLFPNKYAVYLHDTPNKKLFGRDVRAFSSGCVRVQDPLKLAEVLFQQQIKRGHLGLEDQSIGEVIAAKKTKSYRLDVPVEVSTIYLTAEPLASGRVRFHKDIYSYDTAEMASRVKSLVPRS